MNIVKDKKLNSKRETGEFFTKNSVSMYVGQKILSFISPEIVIEPYAGEGSLVEPFIKKNIHCIVNDVNIKNYQQLQKKFSSENFKVFNEDVIATKNDFFLPNSIKSPKEKSLLIYTNPPFGTASTNSLASKKFENTANKSRNISINYTNLEKYGRGDLLLPAVGKLIEMLISQKQGYLAFYSPLGVFCMRKRYNKLLNALLRDFTFIWGEIFSGSHFQDVTKSKPIAVSLWKFNENVNTNITSLTFHFTNKIIPLRPVPLLKEFWRYDTRKKITGEIAVQGNDRFNVMAPKMFHLQVKKGGSEVIEKNLIQPLNIRNIPDELALALWSVVVGYRSLTSYPIYVDNAYVHLPDFENIDVQKILSLTIIAVLITEELNHYTKGKIRFKEESTEVEFGNQKLSTGANYLLKKFNLLKVCEFTVSELLFQMKTKEELKEHNREWRKDLREKIELLLQNIGYWDYIPVPKV